MKCQVQPTQRDQLRIYLDPVYICTSTPRDHHERAGAAGGIKDAVSRPHLGQVNHELHERPRGEELTPLCLENLGKKRS